MIDKLKKAKSKLNRDFNALTDRELNFISGGTRSVAGSSGSNSGSSNETNDDGIPKYTCCDNTTTKCHCLPGTETTQ